MANDGRGPGAKNRQAKRDWQAAWKQALREGRVVRVYLDPKNPTLTSYPSEAAAFDAMTKAQQSELQAEIVEFKE